MTSLAYAEPSLRTPAPARHAVCASEYLGVRVGGQSYGLDILRVQDIRPYVAPTRATNRVAGVLGVMDIDGAALPVVDLRQRLGAQVSARNADTVMIVVDMDGRGVGVVADGVAEVVKLKPAEIKSAANCDGCSDSHHLMGVGSTARGPLFLVDMDALLSDPALGLSAF